MFVSGQIGLIPSSLAIPFPRSPATEIPLVSQHADRVVEALLSNNSGDRHAQIILYWLTQERHVSYAITAAQSLDVSEVIVRFPVLPRQRKRCLQRGSTPALFLVVKDLPKGALIEKQVLYHTGRGFAADDEDGDIARVSHVPLYDSGDPPNYAVLYQTLMCADVFAEAETDIRYEVAYLQGAGASGVVICGRGFSHWKEALRRLETAAHIEGRLARSLSMRLFYNITATSKRLQISRASEIISDTKIRSSTHPKPLQPERPSDYAHSMPLYSHTRQKRLELCTVYLDDISSREKYQKNGGVR